MEQVGMTLYRNHDPMPVLKSEHYGRHVAAMTREDLYSKGDIAEELALRDMEIERLSKVNESLMYLLEEALCYVGCNAQSPSLDREIKGVIERIKAKEKTAKVTQRVPDELDSWGPSA